MTAGNLRTAGPCLVLAALLGALLLTAGAPAAEREPARAAVPAEDSADVGFARDMSVHHQQAVEMSFHLYRHGSSERLRTLAYDIAQAQATQRGMMLGWLDLWGRSASPKNPMAWMDMPPPSDADRRDGRLMPGMLSRTELAQLLDAEGEKADTLFLKRMISHHRGGVHMAEGAVERAGEPVVRRLAQGMLDAQKAEIDEMTHLLRTVDGPGGAPSDAGHGAHATSPGGSGSAREH
ncbi:DUF305 domain-containing protein [Streptomyces sulphureus]|uniref:DUF305 domain-containing protein n=1 Tax=Streptomyces sulphureus TaxID=47758 RepID=UPI000373845A|nr:DUF305 domain-containing protein [Streptomyces sulphureus]